MTLQDRLQELVAEHNQERAVTLAKAAMRNEDVVDVTVNDDEVVVETERFRGVHRWWTNGDGRIVLDERGTYACTCDGVDLSFSTMRMLPEAHDRAMQRLRRYTAAERDAADGAEAPTGADASDGRSRAATGRATGGRSRATGQPADGRDRAGASARASTVPIPTDATAVTDGGASDDGDAPDDAIDRRGSPEGTPPEDGRSRTASVFRTVRRLAGRFL